ELSYDMSLDYTATTHIYTLSLHDALPILNAGLKNFPSIRFGLEMALLDFFHEGKRILFPSEFTTGNASIRINGLIWMGGKQEMRSEEHTSELQSRENLVCRLLLEKKKAYS